MSSLARLLVLSSWFPYPADNGPRTEAEYRNTKQRIKEGKAAALKQREQLMAQGLTAEQIERVMEPTLTFQMQFADEVTVRADQGGL